MLNHFQRLFEPLWCWLGTIWCSNQSHGQPMNGDHQIWIQTIHQGSFAGSWLLFFHIVEPFSTSFLAILVLVGFFYGSGVLGGSFNGSNGILCPGLTVATGWSFGSLLLCLYIESCCWVRYNLVFVSLLILGVLSGTTFHHLLLLFGFFTLLFGVSRLRWPLEAEVDRRFQPSSTASINPPNRCWNSLTARVHRRDFRSFQSVHVMKEVVIECRWSSTRRCWLVGFIQQITHRICIAETEVNSASRVEFEWNQCHSTSSF